jgi:hypothetical protein
LTANLARTDSHVASGATFPSENVLSGLKSFSPQHCVERPLSVLMIVSDFTALADDLGNLFENYELDINSCAPIDRDNVLNEFAKFVFASESR